MKKDGSVKVMQFELRKCKSWVCAAKKMGMPTDKKEKAEEWIKKNPSFSSYNVWVGRRKH